MIPFLSPTPTAATPSSDVEEVGSSSNVGAIVGGIVGALLCALVMAAVTVAIWCLIRNRKRRENIYDYVGPPTVPPTVSSHNKPHADVATLLTDTLYPTPTQTDKEDDGYSIPLYYSEGRRPAATTFTMTGESSPKGPKPTRFMVTTKFTITAPAVGHTSTSAQLEMGGLYSDPRYYGEGRKPEATSDTITGENSPKGAEPSRSMGTTKFDITAPDVDRTIISNQSSLEMGGLYSDPRYYGEGRIPEATSGTIIRKNSPIGQEPGRSVGTTKCTTTAPDVGHTSTTAELEVDGLYSDPRYYRGGRKSEATSVTIIGGNSPKGAEPSRSMGTTKCSVTAPDVGHASTTTQLEVDGLYSDPRYYGEGRKSKATSGTIARENSPKGAEPSSSQGTNKCNTTAPDVGRTSTAMQSALEMDGYSDPRYLR